MESHGSLLLVIGLVLIFSALSKPILSGFRLPVILGYLLVGLLLNGLSHSGLMPLDSIVKHALDVLGELGLMFLLFRVGIRSDLKCLLQQFKKALIFGTSNFLLSGFLGFLVTYYVLQSNLIASLFVGVALSATSVGVATAMWADSGQLETDTGGLLIDMAELDDLLGIAAMIILFAVVPSLMSDGKTLAASELGYLVAILIFKAIILISGSYLFARFLESKLSCFLVKVDPTYNTLIAATAGTCVLISALSYSIGFSVAVGAFFAGLAYSKDPNEHNIENALEYIYQVFAPFFFVGIALSVDFSLIFESVSQGLILIVVAILGKVVGVYVPAFFTGERKNGLLLGVSMIPRAEIALFIAMTGMSMEGSVLPRSLFGALVFVAISSCLIAPILIKFLLVRFRSDS